MNIHVSQKHIDAGKPGDCGRCPIAFAIKDGLYKLNIDVNVSYDRVIIFIYDFDMNGYVVKTTPTTNSMKSFIHHFDQREPVKPFTFRLGNLNAQETFRFK